MCNRFPSLQRFYESDVQLFPDTSEKMTGIFMVFSLFKIQTKGKTVTRNQRKCMEKIATSTGVICNCVVMLVMVLHGLTSFLHYE